MKNLIEEYQEKYPYNGMLSDDDATLLKDAEDYKKVRGIRVSEGHFKHIKTLLNIEEPDQEYHANFYVKAVEGYIIVLPNESGFVDLWLWVEKDDPEYWAENWAYEKIFKRGHNKVLKSLTQCLDLNLGGNFSEAAKKAASMIIYG